MKRTALPLLLLLVLPAWARAQWYESYAKGVRALKAQQWQQAVNDFSEAIDDQPDSKANKATYGLQFIDYFPYLYRGVAYYRLGDMANAKSDLEKAKSEGAVADAQWDEEAPKTLSEYIALVEKPAQAAKQNPPAQAAKQNPPPAPQPDPHYVEGLRLFNQKDYRGAIAQFTGVPQGSAQHGQALRYIDQAQAEVKKQDAAEQQRQQKEQAKAAFDEGVRLFTAGDLDRAEEKFTSVTTLDRSYPDVQKYLRQIRDRKGRMAAAPAAGGAQPSSSGSSGAADTAGSALFREAVSLYDAGKTVKSKEEFLRLQSLHPSYPGMAERIRLITDAEQKARSGIAAFLDGEYREAIDRLSGFSVSGSDNPHVHAFLACSYAAEYLLGGGGDAALKREAVEAFGRTRALDPGYALDAKFVSPRIIALLSGN